MPEWGWGEWGEGFEGTPPGKGVLFRVGPALRPELPGPTPDPELK